MSKNTADERPRRADAERNLDRVLDAALRLFGDRPTAGMAEIAAEAGVSRQTVYAHFPNRAALLEAVVDRATDQVVAELDAADLERGSATDALLRLLESSWRMFERYPMLAGVQPGSADDGRHEPIADRLLRLIVRGQRSGEFDATLEASWLVAATVALGHAAGEEVAAGRLSAAVAMANLRSTALRVYGAHVTGP